MPLKYYAGFPLAVKIVGWAHGVLFIAYIAAVFMAIKPMKWNFWDFCLAIGASLLPFGTFFLDKGWRAREKSLSKESIRTAPEISIRS